VSTSPEHHQLSSPFQKKQQRTHILTISLAVVALLVAIGFFVFYLRGQKTGIQVLEPTTDITIKLNGRTTATEKNEWGLFVPLYAGQYRLELDKPGYLPFIQDIQAEPGSILEIRPAFTLLPSVNEATGASIDFVRPSADEKSVYYLGDYRQRLFRLEVGNQTTVPLTDAPLSGVIDVQWGSNPDVALIVQSNGTYLHEIPRFDFQHQIYIKIGGPEIVSPVWDPNNPERIAAGYFTDKGEQSLVVADKRFTTVTRLATIQGIPAPKIIWSPDSNFILLIGRSSTYSLQNLWMYTLSNGDLRQLTTEGGVKDASFSPDSTRIIIEKTSQSGQTGRQLLTLENGQVQTLDGTIPLRQTAWKDASSFYEPSSDNHALILRKLDGSSERTPLSLPRNEQIENLFYFDQPSKVIIATRSAVYTVNLEKK
jgi:hypothetical protein